MKRTAHRTTRNTTKTTHFSIVLFFFGPIGTASNSMLWIDQWWVITSHCFYVTLLKCTGKRSREREREKRNRKKLGLAGIRKILLAVCLFVHHAARPTAPQTIKRRPKIRNSTWIWTECFRCHHSRIILQNKLILSRWAKQQCCTVIQYGKPIKFYRQLIVPHINLLSFVFLVFYCVESLTVSTERACPTRSHIRCVPCARRAYKSSDKIHI